MSQIRSMPRVQSGQTRSNKRATVRYRCAPATIGKLYISEDHEYQHAWVVNLSLAGAGLILTRPVPVGNLVMMHIKSNEPTKTYELVAHVVHCTSLPHGEWSVGCELVHSLSAEDLDLLL